jgi:hypothetical protein
MEVTEYEIKKMHPTIRSVHYEDFVKAPKQFISDLLEYAQLKPSKMVNAFMPKIAVENRNNRAAVSAKTTISDETKARILEMVNSGSAATA